MATTLETMFKAFVMSLIFISVSMPITYKLTGYLSDKLAIDGCPTNYGHLVHTLVFFVVAILMSVLLKRYQDPSNQKSFGSIISCSIDTTLLFYLLSSSSLYELTTKIIPEISVNGCPGYIGVLVHGFVFMLILFASYMLPRD